MSITRLRIENFRSLAEIDWRPGPLNVLIGPNGSGKSNLLEALAYLQTAASGKFEEGVLRAGGMGALVWDSRDSSIAWDVDFTSADGGNASYHLKITRVGFTAEFNILNERADASTTFLEHFGPSAFINGKAMQVWDALDALHQPIIAQLGQMDPHLAKLASRLRSIAVYHNIAVHREAEVRHAAVARRDTVLLPDARNLIPVLHTLYSTDRQFKETMNNAMRAAFGEEFEELTFPPAADQRVDLRLRWRSLRTEQSAANLSDGTLRFLILVTILASPTQAEVIAIDEPELGLHPHMLPLIADLAQDRSDRTQVIFTTHSPQFLDAFAEPPQTTVCTIGDGKTKLATLSGSELARWLERYSLGELFRSGELEAMA